MSKNVRWPNSMVEPEVDLFPDFSETITSALEDTMRNLKVLDQGNRRHTHEYSSFELQALQNFTDEVKDLRSTVAKLITTSKVKASKTQFDEFKAEMTAKVDKRLDTIRTMVLGGISIGFTVLGLLLTLRGKLG